MFKDSDVILLGFLCRHGSSNVTLFANGRCTDPTMCTFESMGRTVEAVHLKTEVRTKSDPTKGFNFVGWFQDSELIQLVFDVDTLPVITLFANGKVPTPPLL